MMPEPWRQMIERRFPRPAVRRAMRRVGQVRDAKLRYREARREPLAIEEIAGPAPDPCDHSPPAEAWDDAALLESYERDDPADDYNDEFDDEADEIVEIVTRPRRGEPSRPDFSRFLAAMREKARPAAAPAPTPRPVALPVAPSSEECRSCGIPGFKGCAHQAPYVRPLGADFATDREPRMKGTYRRLSA